MSSFSVPPLVSGINFDIGSFAAGMQQMAADVHSFAPVLQNLEEGMKESVEHGVAEAGAALQLFPPLLVEFVENPALGAVAAIKEAFEKLQETVTETANHFQQVNLGSIKTGLDPETFSTFTAAAKASGVEVQTFTNGLDLLLDKAQNALRGEEGAAKGFDDLHISVAQLGEAVKDPKELLLLLADRLHALPTAAERAAAAMEVMGKGGKEMLPFLQQGRAGIEELSKHLGDLGARVDDTEAQMGAAWAKASASFSAMWEKLETKIATPIMQYLADHAGELGDALETVAGVVESIIGLVEPFVPVLKIAADLLKTIADSVAIVANAGAVITNLLGGDLKGAGEAVDRMEASGHRVLRDIGAEAAPKIHVETHVHVDPEDLANKTAEVVSREVSKGWRQREKEMAAEHNKDKVKKATRGGR